MMISPATFISPMIMDKRGPVLWNVPVSPVNVIAEDNINENILYLGTDNGLCSLNRGKVGKIFRMVCQM
jgi:hypothetical protein